MTPSYWRRQKQISLWSRNVLREFLGYANRILCMWRWKWIDRELVMADKHREWWKRFKNSSRSRSLEIRTSEAIESCFLVISKLFQNKSFPCPRSISQALSLDSKWSHKCATLLIDSRLGSKEVIMNDNYVSGAQFKWRRKNSRSEVLRTFRFLRRMPRLARRQSPPRVVRFMCHCGRYNVIQFLSA